MDSRQDPTEETLTGIIDELGKQVEDVKKSDLVPRKLEKAARLEKARVMVQGVFADCALAVGVLRETLQEKEVDHG